jgi:D-alanyl-lipoteichoic acid acyltransferase DltB (MBOAT superfamily)
MLFSSYEFLFQFLPATILAFAAARRHSPRAGIMVLAGASLVFYGAWRPIYLLLLIASIAINFSLGLRMNDPVHCRAIGSIGVAINLAVLGYFKYTGFLIDSISALSGIQLPFSAIILPLGISFFTFQQIAYLVDIMRGAKVERDIVSYMLFVSFFPHLIAGPLVHHAEMIPQFKRSRTGRSAILAARGLAIFVAGLFKKVVIADSLVQFVSPVFAHLDNGGGVTLPLAWLAILAYTLQIYYDFSGYSDMAVGLALLFGIRLPVNFRSPYQAASIVEFRRLWHITLSRFLRDYLYIPLGGTRVLNILGFDRFVAAVAEALSSRKRLLDVVTNAQQLVMEPFWAQIVPRLQSRLT